MNQRKKTCKRLLSCILSFAMFVSMFMGMDLSAKAYTVWTDSGTGSYMRGTSGSVTTSATGSYCGDRYTIIPSYTGVYRFYSSRSSGDPYIQIADSYNWSYVRSAIQSAGCKSPGRGEFGYNDDGNGDLNFDLYAFLEKGKTYHVFLTRYSTSNCSYRTYYQYLGTNTITLNKNSGTGGTSYLYGGKAGYTSACHSAYDGWFSTSTSSATISTISIPTRSGYQFLGYYGDNGVQYINANGVISSSLASMGSITLTAKWKALSCVYTLNAPEADATSSYQTSVTVNQGSTMPTLSSLPTRTGYDFAGYWTGTDKSGVQYYSETGTSLQTSTSVGVTVPLYAGWTPKTYNVTLSANGGSGGRTINVTYDAPLPTAFEPPVKTGYDFKGFYYDINGENQEQFYTYTAELGIKPYPEDRKWTLANDGVTLYAKWEPITYKIQLYSNDDINSVGGSSGFVSEINATYGELCLPTAEELGLTREHYDFVGWNMYDEQDWAMFQANTDYRTGLADTSGDTVQIYAVWKMKDNFTITYNTNGGVGGPRNVTVFNGEDYVLQDSDREPTYQNHTFLGWYLTSNGNDDDPHYRKGTANDTIQAVSENITLYARWKEDKTVAYNANGGSFANTIATSYHHDGSDVEVNFSELPTRTGYTFEGWAKTADAETADYRAEGTTTFTMGNENVILYAVWSKNVYDIDYSGFELVTIAGSQGAAPTSIAYHDDYSFTISVDERLVDTSSMIVYVNDIAMVTPNPTVDENDSNIKNYRYVVKSVVGNQHVEATGIEQKYYSINYVTNEGSFSGSYETQYIYSANEADVVVLPTDSAITRDGYSFLGWYDNAALTGEAVTEFSKNCTEDKYFYAKWEPVKYRVTYDSNIPVDFQAQSDTTVSEEPTLREYDSSFRIALQGDMKYRIGTFEPDFLGWSTEATAMAADYSPDEVVRNLSLGDDVTLYAVWDVPAYKVSFDLNGGASASALTTIARSKGQNVELPFEGITREGYNFLGWNDGTNLYDGAADNDAIESIDNNYALTAVWEAKVYDVNYHIIVSTGGELRTSEGSQITDAVYDAMSRTYTYSDRGTYGQDYRVDNMPYVMHDLALEEYEQFLIDDPLYKAYLDKVAANAAWNAKQDAHDNFNATFYEDADQEVIDGEKTSGDVKTYDTASHTAWETYRTQIQNGITQETYKNYVVGKYEELFPEPADDISVQPEAPAGDEPVVGDAVLEPDICTAPSTNIDTVFLGWSDAADSDEILYAPNQTSTMFTGDDEIDLYAVFGSASNYYLNYDLNDGHWAVGGELTTTVSDAGKFTIEIPSPAPVKKGYTFEGWAYDESTTYNTTVQVSADANKTVKAVWKPISYTIRYNVNDRGAYWTDQDEPDPSNHFYVPGIVGVDGSEVDQQGNFTAPPSMSSQLLKFGETAALRICSFISNNHYIFKGWSTQEEATAVEFLDGESVRNLSENDNDEIDLYAVWQQEDAYIRFNGNGGMGAPSAIYRNSDIANVTYSIPTDIPTKEGYTFKGWAIDPENTEADYEVSYDGAMNPSFTPATGDFNTKTILYAVWKENPYCNIVYSRGDANGSVPVDENRYYVNDFVYTDFAITPSKPGYHFTGWSDGTNTYYESADPSTSSFEITAADISEDETKTITLTAVMAVNDYDVEFYYGDTLIKSATLTYDQSTSDSLIEEVTTAYENEIGEAEVDCYTLKGWSLLPGGGVTYENNVNELYNLSVVQDAVVKLYAVVEPKQVTVTFDNGGGAGETTSVMASYGEILPPLSGIPTKTGYVFAGYYESREPSATDVPVYDSSLNATKRSNYAEYTTLYAKWEPKTYKIIYVYEGVTLKTQELKYKDTPEARKIAMAGSDIFETGVIVSGATYLYGWSKNGMNDNSDEASFVYRAGTGDRYDMWNDGADTILYPVIEEDAKATVTYNANGGTGCPVDTKTSYQVGDSATVLFDKIPTRTDYEFIGWSTDPNLDAETAEQGADTFYAYTPGGENNYQFSIKRSTTLYAIWKLGTYTVTYRPNVTDATLVDGAVNVLEVERGATLLCHAGEIYERNGYVLEGWSTSSNSKNAVSYDLGSTIDRTLTTKENIDLYAVWSPVQVRLVFETFCDNSISDIMAEYDSLYGLLPTPERSGYTFDGWYLNYDEETDEYSDKVLTSTRIENTSTHRLYAKWTEDIFEINYHTNYGEDEIITKRYKVDDQLVLCGDSDFGRVNHKLVGYAMSPNGPVVYDSNQELGSRWATKNTSINLYCIWDVSTFIDMEVNQSYIYYVPNGAATGQVPAYGVYDNGSAAVISDNVGNMGKYGYVFNGWNTELDGSGTLYMPGDEVVVEGSLVLFAQWGLGEYRLTLSGDEGIVADSLEVSPAKDTYNYEDEITLSVKVKDGYTFSRFVSDKEDVVASSAGNAQDDERITYTFKMPGEDIEFVAATNSKVILNANGGLFADSTQIKNYTWENGCAFNGEAFEVPARAGGYYFIGWFADRECTRQFDVSDVIDGETILYAGWGYQAGEGSLRVISIRDAVYTGSKVTPFVLIKEGDRVLVEGVDYTISYKNNVNVNKNGKFVDTNALIVSSDSVDGSKLDKNLPYVIIKGKGNYSKVIMMNFNIRPKNLGDIDYADGGDLTLYYDQYMGSSSKAQKPNVVLTYTAGANKSKTLKAKTDYTVTYSGAAGNNLSSIPANASGTYEMTVKAADKGNYTGSITRTITIASEAKSLGKATVTVKNATLTKNMSADELKITVKLDGKTLKAGEDYVALFEEGIPAAPGTYAVLITPAEGSAYVGAKTAKVKLAARKLKGVKLNMVSNAVYNGEDYGNGIKSIVDNGVLLVEGEDYVTSYKGGVNAGSVTVKITGIGIYNGSSLSKKYTISAYDLAADADQLVTVISPDEASEYSKSGAKAEFTVKYDGRTLVEGVDYTTSYKNNKKITSEYAVTKPEIIITGKGNFKGSISCGTFMITRKTLGDDAVIANATDVIYSENAALNIKFNLVEKDSNKKLVAGTDYDKNSITYSMNGVKIDTCPSLGSLIDVTVKGLGNYKGDYTFTVKVVGASISKAKVNKITKTYSGEEVTLNADDVTMTYKIATKDEAAYFNADGTYIKAKGTAPSTNLKVGDTIILKEGRDFTLDNIAYTGNVNSGSAMAQIEGIGFFGDSKIVKFSISKKAFGWTK